MKRNITKQLCVAVYELLTALLGSELPLLEEEITEHVHSTQYQFKVFKNVNCFMSLHRHHLDNRDDHEPEWTPAGFCIVGWIKSRSHVILQNG